MVKDSKLLSEDGIDVAIVNGVILLLFKPKIAVNHGITLKPSKLYLLFAKELYRRNDKVICVSSKTRNEVRNLLNVDCEVIPIPLKLELFKPLKSSEREDTVIHIDTRAVKTHKSA